MANLQVVYYRSLDGTEPVNDFIDRLEVRRQVALDNQIDRLFTLTPASPHLPFRTRRRFEVSSESSGATTDASSTGCCIGAPLT